MALCDSAGCRTPSIFNLTLLRLNRRLRPGRRTGAVLAGVLLATAPAAALDLTVQSLQVNQAVQFGTTRLVGGKVTYVRATIGVTGSGAAVSGVDALLRVYSQGQEVSGSPFFSLNGPIAAPLSPQTVNLNHTVNFAFVPPVSNDVDFTVVVNPTQDLSETSFANNTLSVNNKNFECRAIVEVAYVPINYTPGLGLPPADLIEPGIGDGFIRAIYSPAEFNYHRSPLPPLLWTQSINGSSNQLLNTLHDIRINQLPAAGYPTPPFIFGWLPGNPFSGNGKSIGVPGDAAFGNTELGRHQRTFAHELGHLVGLQHNSQTINTVGIDTEHQLWDTQLLDQVFESTLSDIMVAGLMTNQAFVSSTSYNKFLDDPRTQCGAGLSFHGEGELLPAPVLRVSGVIDAATRTVQLNPVTRIDRGRLTLHDPAGDLLIASFDNAGRQLGGVGARSDTSIESCASNSGAAPIFDPASPFTALIPQTINSHLVTRVEVRDVASGRVLASIQRSPNAPAVLPLGAHIVGAKPGAAPTSLLGRVQLTWTGSDADGDSLTYTLLYSPDGGHRWLPLAVNTTATSFEFDTTDIPHSQTLQGAPQGVFRITATDGLNHGEGSWPVMAVGIATAPEVYLLTPNDGDSYPQHAAIPFHAAAWDLSDLMLDGDSIEWMSSVNGLIGTGRIFTSSVLVPGTHTITLKATNDAGLSATRQITLTITPRTVVSPDFNGDGHVNGMDLAMLLAQWGPCAGACSTDLNLDGVVDGLDLAMMLASWG